MTLGSWIAYIFIGKLFIYLWGIFPLPQFLEENKIINKLHTCSLCSGVWIYSVLSFFMGMSLLNVLGFTDVLIVSQLITGGAISFVVHIFSVGWRDFFAPDIVL
jgi:hypothetical protein